MTFMSSDIDVVSSEYIRVSIKCPCDNFGTVQ